jgi:predicted permease
VQTSLVRGEVDSGASILSQYNPHGVFVALEDVGYLTMCLAFLATGAALAPIRRSERALRGILVVAGAIGVVALPVLMVLLGTDLEYHYEVLSLTLCWLALIPIGILVFRASRPVRV